METIIDKNSGISRLEAKIYSGKKLSEQDKEQFRFFVDSIWDDHADVGNRFPRWKKYIAWVAGYQLYDYNKYSKKLIEMPLNRKKRLVFNRLRSFVRTMLAKLSSDVPQMSVVPKTSEYADIEAARAGDRLIEHLSDKIDLPKILSNVKLWSIVCNRSFLRVFWDGESKGTVGYDEEDEGQEITDDGDVNMEDVSPFNCRVDPLYFEWEKWRWFVFGDEIDAGAIEREYKLKKGSLHETSQTLGEAFDLELGGDNEIILGSTDTKEEITGRTIVFKEFWTPKIYVFTAGNKVVEYGLNPYEEIPFYPVEERLIPISNYEKGFQYNESLVKDAIGVQREYNRMNSIKGIALERASKLKVLVPFGSMISKKQVTNDYGVFIDYNPKMGAAPHQMRLDPVPSFIETYTQGLEREFEVIFGVREASFGRLPERASHASGTLVNLLLEQDDVLLNPLLATINKALGRAWSLALRMAKDNYSLPRMIRYVGEDGTNSVMKFRAADLQGNTDVKVVSQSGLPRSRALRIEYIMKLREAGLLPDDKNVLEMLEFGQADKIFKDHLLHEQTAYKEHEKIKGNPNIKPEEVEEWIHPLEDMNIHAKIHARLLFGAEMDKLNENQRKAIDMHAQITVEKINEGNKAAREAEVAMFFRAKEAGMKVENPSAQQ